jgi:type III pantothenate kinase
MRNLVIDVGNSHTKAGIFVRGELRIFEETTSNKELVKLADKFEPDYIIICSVTKPAEVLQELLFSYAKKVLVLDYKLPLPVNNLYESPQTLGMDRIASVCGAKKLFPEDNSLVIDIGTCIKYDFVEINGNYYGGIISPGVQMRFQAMHKFTAKLPLVNAPENGVELIGRNTTEALQSGVINGMLAEIEGIIIRYKQQFVGYQALVCGGDAHYFETKINSPIFAVPKLVLVGLDSILQYNVS